jgi:hypothetical protein
MGTAHEMAASVPGALSARLEVRPVVGHLEELLQSLPRNELLLFGPRLWDPLPGGVRQDERVFGPNTIFVPENLQRVLRSVQASVVIGERNRRGGAITASSSTRGPPRSRSEVSALVLAFCTGDPNALTKAARETAACQVAPPSYQSPPVETESGRTRLGEPAPDPGRLGIHPRRAGTAAGWPPSCHPCSYAIPCRPWWTRARSRRVRSQALDSQRHSRQCFMGLPRTGGGAGRAERATDQVQLQIHRIDAAGKWQRVSAAHVTWNRPSPDDRQQRITPPLPGSLAR